MPYSFKIFCANFNHGNSNSCNTRHLITNYTELTISFLYPLFFLDQYEIFLNKCLRKPKGNQEWTIQRKPKEQSRMDNPEKTKGAIKNGQSRDTGNTQGLGASEKKTKKNYIILQGGELTCSHFFKSSC